MVSKTKNAKHTPKRVLRIQNVNRGVRDVRVSNDSLRNSFFNLVGNERKLNEGLLKAQRSINNIKSVQKSKIFSFLSNKYGFNNAFRAVVCSKRSERRRALFSAGRAGFGKRIYTEKLHTELSKVRC